MNSATDYRNQAAACRRAANLSKGQPTPYLIDMAKDYEMRAARLEARFAGDTPGAYGPRDSE